MKQFHFFHFLFNFEGFLDATALDDFHKTGYASNLGKMPGHIWKWG